MANSSPGNAGDRDYFKEKLSELKSVFYKSLKNRAAASSLYILDTLSIEAGSEVSGNVLLFFVSGSSFLCMLFLFYVIRGGHVCYSGGNSGH